GCSSNLGLSEVVLQQLADCPRTLIQTQHLLVTFKRWTVNLAFNDEINTIVERTERSKPFLDLQIIIVSSKPYIYFRCSFRSDNIRHSAAAHYSHIHTDTCNGIVHF